MRTLIAVGFLCATLVLASDASADQTPVSTLTVVGEGTVSLPPELAIIRLAVVTESENATVAASENAAKIAAVIEALSEAGVGPEDIDTSRFSIQPRYSRPSGDQGGSMRIDRYQVENEVTVKTRAIDQVGKLIGASIDGGANRVSSLNYAIDDVTGPRADAITAAAEIARAEAATLARATGVRLVEVQRMDLSPSRSGGIFQQAQSSDPPINPGNVEVRAYVTITYRIEGGGG